MVIQLILRYLCIATHIIKLNGLSIMLKWRISSKSSSSHSICTSNKMFRPASLYKYKHCAAKHSMTKIETCHLLPACSA